MLTLNRKHKRRLIAIIVMLLGLSGALAFGLYALRQNINLFYTPSQVVAGQVPTDKKIRIGGMVVKGSVQHQAQGLAVEFVVTDLVKNVKVKYTGILPDLFRDGQGVVTDGQLSPEGYFRADRVLAKHDENYMPPEVKHALAEAKKS
jgi:cytochrome c-type biogenesis protein CcmE